MKHSSKILLTILASIFVFVAMYFTSISLAEKSEVEYTNQLMKELHVQPMIIKEGEPLSEEYVERIQKAVGQGALFGKNEFVKYLGYSAILIGVTLLILSVVDLGVSFSMSIILLAPVLLFMWVSYTILGEINFVFYVSLILGGLGPMFTDKGDATEWR